VVVLVDLGAVFINGTVGGSWSRVKKIVEEVMEFLKCRVHMKTFNISLWECNHIFWH
jgi:hypothetical protein